MLIQRTFLPFEAEEIVGIPLSVGLLDDKQVWAKTSNGFFSVRSAYKVALELESDKEACSCSNENNLCLFWKKLWSIQIPSKLDILLGGLPETFCQLRKIWFEERY